MSKYNTYDQIKAYLYNRMSVEDRVAFEVALQRDKAFAEQFEDLKLDFQIREAILKEDLWKNLKEWDEARKNNVEKEEEPEPRNVGYSKYIVGVIVLLLLAGVAYCLWILGNSNTPVGDKIEATSKGAQLAIIPDPSDSIENTVQPLSIDRASKEPVSDAVEEGFNKSKNAKSKEPKANPNENIGKITSPDIIKESEKDTSNTTDSQSSKIDPTAIPLPPEIKKDTAQQSIDSIPFYIAEIDAHINRLINSDEITTTRSIDSLAAMVEADSTDSESKYDLGLRYYQQDSLANAIKYLEAFKEAEPNHGDIEDAQLILCMAYLKTKQRDKAKSLLDKITTIEKHLYHKRFGNKLKVIWDSIKKQVEK